MDSPVQHCAVPACSRHPAESEGTSPRIVPDALGLDSLMGERFVWCSHDDSTTPAPVRARWETAASGTCTCAVAPTAANLSNFAVTSVTPREGHCPDRELCLRLIGDGGTPLIERMYIMTSECKGGGMFVGKWSVTVRNTTSCPVCRLAQPVRPYGGRYKIADHRGPKTDKGAPPQQ
jgi:hypothetical protein